VQDLTNAQVLCARPLLLASELAEGESDVPYRRWVHVAPFGEQWVEGYAEKLTFSREDAESVVAFWEHDKAHGHDAVFDFNHGMIRGKTPEEKVRAADVLGWDIRDNGLWALAEFTSQATDLVKAGGYPLSSPVILRGDKAHKNLDTGQWEAGTYIPLIALTATPEQGGLEAIAASRRWTALAQRFGMDDAKDVIRAIRGKVEELAVGGAFGPVDVYLDGSERYQCDVWLRSVDPDWTRVVVENNREGRHYSATVEEADGQIVIRDIAPGRMEFVPDDTPAELARTPQPAQEGLTMAREFTETELAAMGEALGARPVEDVAAALALRDAAPEGITPETIVELASRPAPESMDAVRGELKALSTRFEEASTELSTLKAEKADRDAEALVDAHPEQIVPAMRDKWLALAKKDPETFKALAADLPKQISLDRQGGGTVEPTPSDDPATPTTLGHAIDERIKAAKEAGQEIAYDVAMDEVLATDEGKALARTHQDQYSGAAPATE